MCMQEYIVQHSVGEKQPANNKKNAFLLSNIEQVLHYIATQGSAECLSAKHTNIANIVNIRNIADILNVTNIVNIVDIANVANA